MGTFFDKLPKKYRDALDNAIQDADSGENPKIAAAWKEYEAEVILESKLDALNLRTTKKEAGSDYLNFRQGWQAAEAENTR